MRKKALILPTSCFILPALAVRLGLAAFSAEVADTANYRRVAEILEQGGRLYRDTPGIYPYPPVWALVEQAALWLAQHTAIGFVFWAELLPVLADVGIVYLLYLFTRSEPKMAAVPLLYAFNPLPILICAVHGQFDALPVFFVLMALYLFEKKRFYWWAALALMAAIALKGFPVLVLLFFILRLENWRQRCGFGLLAVLPVLGMLLPFLLSDAAAVNRELLGYSGYPDQGWVAVAWGAIKLISPETVLGSTLQTMLMFSKVLFLVGYVLLIWFSLRKGNSHKQSSLMLMIALVFATFYALYGGLSSQYLLWLLPFVLLLNLRAAIGYSLLATVAVLAFYNYQWPAIIYRTPVQLLPKTVAAGLWLLGTGLWWLAVVIQLGRFIRTRLPGHREFSD